MNDKTKQTLKNNGMVINKMGLISLLDEQQKLNKYRQSVLDAGKIFHKRIYKDFNMPLLEKLLHN